MAESRRNTVWYVPATAENNEKPANPPTEQDIIEMWHEMQRWYSLLKYQQEFNHAYYTLKVKISTPSGYDAVLPPSARRLVNDAADHVATADPLFTVPKPDERETTNVRVEKLQRWMKAFWERINRGKPSPIHRDLSVEALSKGMSAIHIRWIPERMPKKPKGWPDVGDDAKQNYLSKLRLAFPFAWDSHDPRYVYPDPATSGQTYVIERMVKTVGQVQRAHPEWAGWTDSNGKARDPNDIVEWIYYCDRWYRGYLADGKWVSMSPKLKPGAVCHRLGYVPWVIRSAGISVDSGLPDERYQSMLHTVQGLLDEEMRAWSQGQAIIKDAAWPWTVTPIGARVDPGARRISEVPPELVQHIKQMRPDSEAPKAVVQWLEMVREEMERATYSSVVTGRAPSGQRSGYSIAVMAGMARVKFGPILYNIQSALAEAMEKTLLMIENEYVIGEPVRIWNAGTDDFVIGPKDIKGYHRVDCEIKADLMQDRAADADIGMKAYSTGKLSAETLLKEYLHIPEPWLEIDRRLAEDVLFHPAMVAIFMDEVAREKGIGEKFLRMFEAVTGQSLTGQPPGGGAPGQTTPQGQTSPGGTPPAPGPAHGMQGTGTPGAPAPPGRPSIPGPGPTSPMGPKGAGALQQVAQLPRQISQSALLGQGPPLG